MKKIIAVWNGAFETNTYRPLKCSLSIEHFPNVLSTWVDRYFWHLLCSISLWQWIFLATFISSFSQIELISHAIIVILLFYCLLLYSLFTRFFFCLLQLLFTSLNFSFSSLFLATHHRKSFLINCHISLFAVVSTFFLRDDFKFIFLSQSFFSALCKHFSTQKSSRTRMNLVEWWWDCQWMVC